MLKTLFVAIGLMLVLEGLMPLLVPAVWRETFTRIARLADGQLRFMGLCSLVAGFVIVIIFAK
ncbi:MAG TPA: DUF2065 domain-containing protein [Rhodocyclaceae bacterium]|jgi:uncharacterized protein YjeT (DUF2065 family)|nr:DUF2065 domain-containing protein [Rhodocyclaceae bacterium]